MLAGLIQDSRDAVLVDGPQRTGGYAQRDPAVLLGNVETLLLKVHIESAPRPVVRVRRCLRRGE